MNRAIILAAGMGSRLKSAHTAPKPLTDLKGEVSLLRLFRQFAEAGISEVAVVLGWRGDEIRQYVEEHYRGSLKLTWYFNDRYTEPNGISVLAAREFVTERALLSMADHLFVGSPIEQLAALSPQGEKTYLLIDKDLESVFDMPDATKVLTDDEGNVLDIGKEIENFNAVDTGLFCISPALIEALDELPSPNLSQGVKRLSERGLMGTIELQSGLWQDIDTPEALAHALTLFDSESE